MHFLNLESADITGTIRISFFEDSYQFNQETVTVNETTTFEDIKTAAADQIKEAVAYRKSSYWATFDQLQPDGKYVEIVNQRLK